MSNARLESANPLLYFNMGGEMLYVLRQRLKAQRIAVDKSVQVLDEVTRALINPLTVSDIFKQHPTAPIDLPLVRSNLERAVLSSIMRLDESSMGKLFDLMIMMVKYQIYGATGPRELLLVTLNHIDTMRDMLTDSSGYESLKLVHRMLVQLYGNFTYDRMWQTRKLCLTHLDPYNVRVSILLRLGLQNQDASFNPPTTRNYDEKYEERISDLSSLKLLENSCDACNVGSLEWIGDRVTHLGRNLYSPYYGINKQIHNQRPTPADNRTMMLEGEHGTRAELGMLAIQLGSNLDLEPYSSPSSTTEDRPTNNDKRPFTLRLFSGNEIEDQHFSSHSSLEESRRRRRHCNDPNNRDIDKEDEEEEEEEEAVAVIGHQHRAKLNDICANLIADEEEVTRCVSRKIKLLELMDQLE